MKIMIIAGSNRTGATSTKLCRYISGILVEEGHDVSLFELLEKPVPFYSKSPELEKDDNLRELKRTALEADAFVLASPEYHNAPTGLLKNALDHLGFDHFDSKVVLSVCSTGGAVGTSTLQQLQTIVRAVHGVNCPEWISIGGEQRAFDEQGVPIHAPVRDRVQRVVRYFTGMAQKLRS
jgi:NAD(P)H-dependent FMN reductase